MIADLERESNGAVDFEEFLDSITNKLVRKVWYGAEWENIHMANYMCGNSEEN